MREQRRSYGGTKKAATVSRLVTNPAGRCVSRNTTTSPWSKIPMMKNSCTLHGWAALSPSGSPSLRPCAFSAGSALTNARSISTYRRFSNPLLRNSKGPALRRELPWPGSFSGRSDTSCGLPLQ